MILASCMLFGGAGSTSITFKPETLWLDWYPASLIPIGTLQGICDSKQELVEWRTVLPDLSSSDRSVPFFLLLPYRACFSLIFFFFGVRYVILMLLLYTFFINSFIIPNRSFQNISTGYKCGMNSRAQFHPAFENIHTLWQAIKSVSFDPALRAILYQLSRFLGRSNCRQSTYVLP